MNKDVLKQYLDNNLSSYKIAKLIQKSPSVVRYWIKKYNLQSIYSKSDLNYKSCSRCKFILPRNNFYKKADKFGASGYCKTCTAVVTRERQRKNKKMLVDYMGGSCIKCGYNNCIGALHVHHLDPLIKSKDFYNFKLRTFDDKFKKELESCVLLCSNCHAEEHYFRL